jgi:hypothetical protein
MNRIVVFGTSNCFPGSAFIKGLEKHASVSNMSIGASSSIHAALSVDSVDFADFDFCLLDFAINDDAMRRAGVTLDRLSATMVSIAARAWAANCVPVVVVFPRSTDLTGESVLRHLQLKLAECYSLPFLDLYEVVKDVSAAVGFSYDSAFKDEPHLNWWLAGEVGAHCAAALDGLPDVGTCRVSALWSYYTFSAMALHAHSEGSGTTVVNRQSSTRSGSFVRILPGQALRVPVGPNQVVVGYAANFKTSSGILIIEGLTIQAVDLRTFYRRWNGELIHSALHLPEEVAPVQCVVSLTVPEPLADLTTLKVGVSHGGGDPVSPDEEMVVELSHLIVRATEVTTIPTRPDRMMNVNLWTGRSIELRTALINAVSANYKRVQDSLN